MTRDEFIAQHLDVLAGLLLDAAIQQRTGSDLSIWLRQVYPKLKAHMGAMYDALNAPANGKAKPTVQVARVG